jgi:hypothetical protein
MQAAPVMEAWRPEALGYPWRVRANPATDRAERAAEAWADAQGLLREATVAARYRAVSVGLLAGLTHPKAEPELLELIAQVMAWIFVEDDRHDTARERGRSPRLAARFQEYLRVLETRTAHAAADPTVRSLADLAKRLAERGSPSWYARFVATMRAFWMEGLLVETWYRDHSIAPDPASYMATRVQTVGVYVCLMLVELDGGHELPDALGEDPILRRMTWLTSRVIAYVNDLFSYEKERRAGDPNNFVHAVRHHEGLDLADAFSRTVRAHDRELEQFLRLELALRRGAPDLSSALSPHLAGCRAWMAGALAWQRVASRYAEGRALLEE